MILTVELWGGCLCLRRYHPHGGYCTGEPLQAEAL
jgi:hypothetical protein